MSRSTFSPGWWSAAGVFLAFAAAAPVSALAETSSHPIDEASPATTTPAVAVEAETAATPAAPSAPAAEATTLEPPQTTAPHDLPPAPDQAERSTIGLGLGVEVSSAYVFRGLNVFQTDSQLDQNLMLAPALSYAVPGTGLTLGYWGAFQITGDNAAVLVAGGIGHEQDLNASYVWTIRPETLTLTGGLTWYFYPFADPETTGLDLPSFLEPAVDLAYSGPVTLTMKVAYFVGLAGALWEYSYVYFRPRIARVFEFGARFAFGVGLSFGYKLYTDPGEVVQNVYDVQADWELALRVADGLTLTPAVHLAWTDLDARALGAEFAVWGGLTANLGI